MTQQLELDFVPVFPERKLLRRPHLNFQNLYARLVRNSRAPDSACGCWTWTGLVKNRYPRLNIYTPDGRYKQIRAHRAMAVLMEVGAETEHFWDLYELYSVAQFEGDHLCIENPLCIAPDHVRMLEKAEHEAETLKRGQSIHKRRFSK